MTGTEDSPAAAALSSLPPTRSDLRSAAVLEKARNHVVALQFTENMNKADRAACLRALVQTTRTLVVDKPDTGVSTELVAPYHRRLRKACLTGLMRWRALQPEEATETQRRFVADLIELLADDVDDPTVAERICKTLSNFSLERPTLFQEGINSERQSVAELVERLLDHVRRATSADEPPKLAEQLDVVVSERRAVWLRWAVLLVLEAVPYDEDLVAIIKQFRVTRDAPAVVMGAVNDDTPFASFLGALVGQSSASSGSNDGAGTGTNNGALCDMPRAEQFRIAPLGTVGPVSWRLFLGANPALPPAQRRRRRCLSTSDLPAALGELSTDGLESLLTQGRTTVRMPELVGALCDGIRPAHRSRCNLLWELYARDTEFKNRHLEQVRSSVVQVSLAPDGPVASRWISLVHVAVTDGLPKNQRGALLERLANLTSGTELDMMTAKLLSILLRSPSFTDGERTTAVTRLYDAAGSHPDTVYWLAKTLNEPLDAAVTPDVHTEKLYGHLGQNRLRELYGSLCAAFETHLQGYGSPTIRPYDELQLLATVYDALPATERVVDPNTVLERATSTPPERTRLYAKTELLKRDGCPVADHTITNVLHRAIKQGHLSASRRSAVVSKLLFARHRDDGTFESADQRLIMTALDEGIILEDPGWGTVSHYLRVIDHTDALDLGMTEVMDLLAVVTRALKDEPRVGKQGWKLASVLTGDIRTHLRSERPELHSTVRSLLATSLDQAWNDDNRLDVMSAYRQL